MAVKESTPAVIEQAVERIQAEVPALRSLKLVVGLELRGRGDVQLYRVALPGPDISKDAAADARVRLAVERARFNELARSGNVDGWRTAFESGQARATGPDQILRLVANVAARSRARRRPRDSS
jgi:hypothetical protein